jgi:hypothetical protein
VRWIDMRDRTAIILALSFSGIFSLALMMPQMLASQSSVSSNPFYNLNENTMMDGGMMDITLRLLSHYHTMKLSPLLEIIWLI